MGIEFGKFEFTTEILELAEKLHTQHVLSWNVVAERLGCSRASLLSARSRRKHGKIKGRKEQSQQINAEIEERVVQCGERVGIVAESLNLTPQAVSNRLSSMGWDREMRQEYRKEQELAKVGRTA